MRRFLFSLTDIKIPGWPSKGKMDKDARLDINWGFYIHCLLSHKSLTELQLVDNSTLMQTPTASLPSFFFFFFKQQLTNDEKEPWCKAKHPHDSKPCSD